MKFFILLKKDKFGNDLINDSILSSTNAPSLISNDFIKKDFETFRIYIYTYNHICNEIENKDYKINDSGVSLLNGLITIEDIDKYDDIDEVFDAIRDEKFILGDFQAIKISNDGSSIIETPKASIYPLFYYEDEYCTVISNELKLIVDGVKKFSDNKFVDFYDFTHIHDLFFFSDSKKGSHRNTVFKNIRRILPHDDISIENNQVKIKENEDIYIPESFEEIYLKDYDKFYDWYFDSLMHYSNSLFKQIKDDVDVVVVPVTGGFDSRLQLMIFSKLAPKYGITLISRTSGSAEHPDVIIGEKVAKALNVDWSHLGSDESDDKKIYYKHLPQHFNEYASMFYASQGDFNSYDYISYSRELEDSREFYQMGNDLYKKEGLHFIAKYNRWSSRRRLYRGDFYFPLFATSYELYIARLNGRHDPGQNHFKDLVYNVIKRCEPKLLEIPFANDYLPQLDVDAFTSEDFVGSIHKTKPYLWDYDFVLNELNPLFKPQFDKKDAEFNNILSKLSINSLDYFILKNDFDKLLNDSSKIDEDLKIKLLELKENSYYPKTRTFFDINGSKNYYRDSALLKLMDFASAASFSSFEELEKACSFSGSSNNVLNIKEEVYGQIASNKNDNLTSEYKNTIGKLKNSMKLSEEILSSSSWKVTKPLRDFKNVLKGKSK